MDEVQKQILDLQLSNALHLKKFLDLAQAKFSSKADGSKTVKSKSSTPQAGSQPAKADVTERQVKSPSIIDNFKGYFANTANLFKKAISSPTDKKDQPKSGNPAANTGLIKAVMAAVAPKQAPQPAADDRAQYDEVQLVRFDADTKTFITNALSVLAAKDEKDQEPNQAKKVENTSWWKTLMKPLLLVLGGIAGLITGLMTDGPLKGVLKLISQGGILAWVKMVGAAISLKFDFLKAAIGKFIGVKNVEDIIKTIKGKVGSIFEPVTNFLFKTVPLYLDKIFQPIAKTLGIALKPGTFKAIAQVVAKTILPNLKFIPVLGSLISFGFAVSRYIKGDVIGGTIDLVSGILNLVAPLTGPGAPVLIGLSVGLSVLNAVLDYKAGAASGPGIQTKKFNLLKNWAVNVGKRLVMSSIFAPLYIATNAVIAIAQGKDLKKSLIDMSYAFPFAGTLAGWVGAPKTPEEAYEKVSSSKFMDSLMNILHQTPPFSTISNIITGVKLASQGKWQLAAKAFGKSMPIVSSLIYLMESSSTGGDKISDIIKPTFFNKLFVKVVDTVKSFLSKIPANIVEFIDKFTNIVSKSFQSISITGKSLITGIKGLVSGIYDSVISTFTNIKQAAITTVKQLPKTVVNILQSILKLIPTDIKSFTASIFTKISTAISEKVSYISNTITQSLTKIFSSDLIQMIPDSIKSIFASIRDTTQKAASTISRLLVPESLKDTVTGIASIFNQINDTIYGKIRNFWSNIFKTTDSIDKPAGNDVTFFDSIYTSISTGILSLVKRVSQSVFRDIENLKTVGTGVFDFITEGITSSVKFIATKMLRIKSEDYGKFNVKSFILNKIPAFLKDIISFKDSTIASGRMIKGKISDALNLIGESIKMSSGTVYDSVKSFFASAIEGLTSRIKLIVSKIFLIRDSDVNRFNLRSLIVDKISAFVSDITNIKSSAKISGKMIWNKLSDAFSRVGKYIETSFQSVYDSIKQTLTTAFDNAPQSIKSIATSIIDSVSSFVTRITTIKESVISGGQAIWNKITEVSNRIGESVKTSSDIVFDNVKLLFTSIKDSISVIAGKVSAIAGNIWDKLPIIFDNIVSSVKSITAKIFNINEEDFKKFNLKTFILEKISSFVNDITSLKDSTIVSGQMLWSKISDTLNQVGESIKVSSNTVYDSVKSVFTTITEGITGIARKIPALIDTFWNNLTSTFDGIISFLKSKIPFVNRNVKPDDSKPTVTTKSTLSSVTDTDLFTILTYAKDIRDTLLTIDSNIEKIRQRATTLTQIAPKINNSPVIDVVTKTIGTIDDNNVNRKAQPQSHTTINPLDVKDAPELVKIVQPVQQKSDNTSQELLRVAKLSSDSQIKVIDELKNGEMVKLLSSINNLLKNKQDTGSTSMIIAPNTSHSPTSTGNSAAYVLRSKQRS